jgi:hypothetical protein
MKNSTGFSFWADHNGEYPFTYESKDLVTGDIVPDIYWIDKDPPVCKITYTPPKEDGPTDEYVMAHLDCTDYSDWRVTNNS